MRGPLPADNARRRNAPTIPTTRLPAAGRKGRTPALPKGSVLGEAGRTWWSWAWHTPQSAAWSAGDVYVIARRAALEDDLAVLGEVEQLDALDALEAEDQSRVRTLIGRLAALCTGRLAVFREMRELDDRLGLTPKAMAALRWRVEADDADAPAAGESDEVARRRSEREARLAAGV